MTPIGAMLLVRDANGDLYAADFADCRPRLGRLLDARLGKDRYRVYHGSVSDVGHTLSRYFLGDVHAIESIRVARTGTDFQEKVWTALRELAPGTRCTYGGLARSLGLTGSARAVGSANASNPFCVIIPCHRLVGSDGALTGYSGGLDRKRWLLDHEAERAADSGDRHPEGIVG